VERKCIVNYPFNCGLEILLLTYLLEVTYCVLCICFLRLCSMHTCLTWVSRSNICATSWAVNVIWLVALGPVSLCSSHRHLKENTYVQLVPVKTSCCGMSGKPKRFLSVCAVIFYAFIVW